VVPIADSRALAAAHPGTTLLELDSDHALIDQCDALWAATLPRLRAWGALRGRS
jgi:hypothetical protein